ncbi:hypothetical protein FBU59_002062 [Linderina macrospora]|uniref:Uncharacterized protein n=1 Tax=Linderina macrospora TaxID=4868 RepID=A0ACC1JC57_9FUNG|nr:hypothetical protein FBU59_002062 [Linderina macrospora]
MKFSSAAAVICVLIGTIAVVQASVLDKRNADYNNPGYDSCVKEHGKGHWPFPGEGNCHDVGYCFCDEKTGGISCVC